MFVLRRAVTVGYNSAMQPLTIIFIGRSGSGKGTQADLLYSYLEKKYGSKEAVAEKVFRLETGKSLREIANGPTYTGSLVKGILTRGGLLPEFMTVYVWTNIFVSHFKEGQDILIDGSPRRLQEATALDTAFGFYGRHTVHVVFLDVPIEGATTRLKARGRFDDTDADIKNRMNWFDSDVIPAINYYRDNANGRYTFLDINGDQSIEAVHKDIVKAIFNE